MKDLQQLEKKNKQTRTGYNLSTPMKKKTPSSPHSLAEKKPVNLGDKIKELEDRLFGVK